MRDIEKRLSRLEARRASSGRKIVTLITNHGEDSKLIEDAWRAQHPHEPEPDCFVLVTKFSYPPRLDLASAESVLKVLPHVKAYLQQSPDDAIEEQWRTAARLAGADYEQIQPGRSGYEHADDRWQ